MAHMVFKKPLQNQTVRDNYIKQRQELRHARDMGFIDFRTYDDAKKNLLPGKESFDGIPTSPSMISVVDSESRMSGSTSSSGSSIGSPTRLPGIRKGSILDRNNVARLVYKPNVQGQEDLREQRALRKAQKEQVEAERSSALQSNSHGDSTLDPSPYGQLATGPYPMHLPTHITTSDSRSVKSSPQRMNFNIFRRLTTATHRNAPPPMQLAHTPLGSLLPGEGLPTKLMRHPGSSDTLRSAKSSITRRNTEPHGGGGRGGAALDATPMTLADIFLVGPSPVVKSQTSSRRHSFSSQNSRPSFTSSRAAAAAELADIKAREGFIFESRPSSLEASRHGPQEPVSPRSQPQQPLLSTTTQDVFLSLLKDFANNSILFSYPKHGRVQQNSSSSSFSSVSHPTKISEDEEIGKAIGGEEEEEEERLSAGESTAILEGILEKRTWFLMAMKWLSFGRVLFSPGHYIIELSADAGVGVRGHEASILDLDGAITADWSWHLAHEYPFAKIFNVLLPHSHRPPRNSTAPPNLHFITTTTLSNLSALESNSIDVVTSHNLPRLLFYDKNRSPEELHITLIAILRECARVLKPSGYFEITVVDPVMNNMGPRMRNWVMEHVAPLHNMKPTKMVLAALEQLSGQNKGVLFREVKECWVWMPTTSIGDELSTVTSMVGRHLYDELFAPTGEEYDGEHGAHGVFGKKECKIWKDEKVIEECQKENTAFRWLKCYARKV